MTPKQEEVLWHNVFRPAFIKTCADRGWPITTEEGLQAAFQSVDSIQKETARQSEDLHKTAGAALQGALGIPPAAVPQASMAAQLAFDANIQAALLG